MNIIIFYACIAVDIICTIFMIASFIYADYWERKVKAEKRRINEEFIQLAKEDSEHRYILRNEEGKPITLHEEIMKEFDKNFKRGLEDGLKGALVEANDDEEVDT